MISSHSSIWLDAIGYLAAFLLVLTFFMHRMVSLRLVAISSSVAWLVYGALASIYPVIVLHIVLLPLNAYRLWQALPRRQSETAPEGSS
jgi:CRP/FNR family transcriptional regulator, cyclic AMP receptor protein